MVVRKIKLQDIILNREKVNEKVADALKQIYLGRKGIPCAVIDQQGNVVSNFETAAILKALGVPEIYVEQITI